MSKFNYTVRFTKAGVMYGFGSNLMKDRYLNTMAHKFMVEEDHCDRVLDILESVDSVDCPLYEGDTLIAMYSATLIGDIHYGNVATPILSYIHSEYRNSPEILRWLVKVERAAALALGAEYFYRIKHINNNTSIHKLKRV